MGGYITEGKVVRIASLANGPHPGGATLHSRRKWSSVFHIYYISC